MTVIKIKNSSIAGKEPTAAQLQIAELAVNLTDAKLYTKNAAGNVVALGGSTGSGGSADRPSSPSVGDLFFDTDLGVLLYWDGSAWQEVAGDIEVPTSQPGTPEDGQLWWNTDDNTLYIWYEDGDTGQWVIAVPQGLGSDFDETVADGLYVKQSGDNMTGPLTLGTDKITLDATNGGAEFAGVTRIGDPDNADPTSADASGVRISNAGVIKIKKSAGGGALSVVDENDGTNAYIGSNGNADFSGNVKIGNYNPNAPDAADLGVYGFASGSLWINSNAVDSPVFIARKDNVDRVLLNSDGSAKFAGDVTFTGDTINGIYFGDPGIAASPAGGITMRRRIIDGNLEASGCQLYIYNSKETETAFAIQTAPDGATVKDTKIALNNDGSATFAAGKAVIGADGTTTLLPSGSITDESRYTVLSGEGTGAGGVTDVMAGSYNSGSNWLWNVRRDGSATFGGSLSTGLARINLLSSSSGNRGTAYFRGETGINNSSECISFYIGAAKTGSILYDGNTVFNLEPDNDDNYTTTTEEYTETETYEGPRGNMLEREVTKTRDVRTYTGPTLDVKAVIQDLQQRVADRDAVIADFTTRIQTLEANIATLMSNGSGGGGGY